MGRYVRSVRREWWWACGVLLWLAALFSVRETGQTQTVTPTVTSSKPAAPSKNTSSKTPSKSAQSTQTQKPAPSPADYVGEDTCIGCHQDKAYKGTLH